MVALDPISWKHLKSIPSGAQLRRRGLGGGSNPGNRAAQYERKKARRADAKALLALGRARRPPRRVLTKSSQVLAPAEPLTPARRGRPRNHVEVRYLANAFVSCALPVHLCVRALALAFLIVVVIRHDQSIQLVRPLALQELIAIIRAFLVFPCRAAGHSSSRAMLGGHFARNWTLLASEVGRGIRGTQG
jgi:hypothetical protein